MIASTLIETAAALLAACFAPAQPVQIAGWTGDAMEPFLSRDGSSLFFNTNNETPDTTDIYWAKRVDALHFSLIGRVPGANSAALDGVPSLARDGTFALISPRAYDRLRATVWIGRWTGRSVGALQPQPALTPSGPGGFNMDAEISADGQRLYYTDNRWNPIGPPTFSNFRVARRTNSGWRVDPRADAWFARINEPRAIQYAAGLSADERELYFTRADRTLLGVSVPGLWVSTRRDANAPFGLPARIGAAQGFVEGPTLAPDGALYFHKRLAGRFTIMRAARNCAGSPAGPRR